MMLAIQLFFVAIALLAWYMTDRLYRKIKAQTAEMKALRDECLTIENRIRRAIEPYSSQGVRYRSIVEGKL